MKRIVLLVITLLSSLFADVTALRLELAKALINEEYSQIDYYIREIDAEAGKLQTEGITGYEMMALKYLSQDTSFLSSVDSIAYYGSETYTEKVIIQRDPLYVNVPDLLREFLNSLAYKSMIYETSIEKGTFIDLHTALFKDSLDSDSLNSEVEERIDLIRDPRRREFIVQNIYYKYEPKPASFGITFDLGGAFPVGDLSSYYSNGLTLDFGFNLLIGRMYNEISLYTSSFDLKNDLIYEGVNYSDTAHVSFSIASYRVGYRFGKEKLILTPFIGLGANFTEYGFSKDDLAGRERIREITFHVNAGFYADFMFGKIEFRDLSYFRVGLRGKAVFNPYRFEEVIPATGGVVSVGLGVVFQGYTVKRVTEL